METNGFERRQYSVYVSAEKLTTLDIAVLAQRMAEELPWLSQCVREITATNIGARHSLLGCCAPTRRPPNSCRLFHKSGLLPLKSVSAKASCPHQGGIS